MTGPGVVAAAEATVFGIDRDRRRALVAATEDPALDGIDHVEVLSNRPDSPSYVPGAPRQRTLAVHLLRGPVPVDLVAGPDGPGVVILGGVRADSRLNPVEIEWAFPATELTSAAGASAPVTEADRALVAACVPEEVRAKVLIVRTSSPGDRSTYVLRLLGPAGAAAPAGFDVPLAQAPFTFAVDCPADAVRGRPDPTPPATAASPVLDYLARDYEALRTRLLDRIAVLLPDWTDRSPADIGVTLIELFAYLGDRLSYRQDAVAQEAALSTARRRVSVRRHARLLDYHVHEGCSARTWLAFTTGAEVCLRAGTAVGEGAGPPGQRPHDAAQAGTAVFETCAPVVLTPARNRLLLHAWAEEDHVLLAGARSAFVAVASDDDPALRAGDVLVLAELGPSGTLVDGDPTHRYAVRLDREPVEHVDALAGRGGGATPGRVLEIHWHRDDALPFPLRVSRSVGDQAVGAAVALANIVLADHGASVHDDTPVPAQVPWQGAYRPFLRRVGLAWAAPADPGPLNGVPPGQGWESASAALRPDPRRAVAQLELDDGARRWLPRPDLLDSDRTAAHVVVETEEDRTIRLRFGDGVTGRRPTPGTTMTLRYRLGGGSWGNVGVDTLTELLSAPGGATLKGVSVTNPLPAAGGLDPQPMAEVRELAPRAFRTLLQAVTPDDYAAIAGADGAVRQAVASPRWTGSWYAQQVVVDPDGTAERLFDRLAGLLEVRRTAGVDVEFAEAALVPVEIGVVCCLDPGTLRAQAGLRLREVLSASVLPDGRRGLFHPDNLGFGSSLYLSDLIAQAMSVPGVVQVHVERFCRVGADGDTNRADLTRGRLDASRREILCCRSDPDSPETGFVDLVVRGGA